MSRKIRAALGVLMLMSFSAVVQAQTEMPAGEHKVGSLGFHNDTAPIGIRWWFSGQKVALDAGIGISSVPAPAAGERLTGWAIEVGVPIMMQSWSRAHVMFRPGILYESQQVQTSATPFTTDDATALTVLGEIEAEIFLVDNFSVSASHGLGFQSFNPPGSGSSSTTFGTIGNNFTNVGFHIYLFGGH